MATAQFTKRYGRPSAGRCVSIIHFATVGGTGGIADTCKLYQALRIPVAVIADLDVLTDSDRLARILDALAASDTKSLVEEVQRLVVMVKNLPPTISEAEVRRQMLEALPEPLDWSKEHDVCLRGQLQQLARRLDRMRRLKTASSEPLPAEIQQSLQMLIKRLHDSGLFVVPVGELEEWLADEKIQASKQNKWAWANEAAARIREVGRQTRDVWAFMDSVGDYLQNRFVKLAA